MRKLGWCFWAIAFGCIFGCHSSPSMMLEMVGQGYEWYIHYPVDSDSGGEVVVKRDIYVPANTELKIHLTSRDYIYALKIPEFEQNQMAVPDIAFDLSFNTGAPGIYTLKGDQMCGYTHDTLKGQLVVLAKADYERWITSQAQQASVRPGNGAH